MDSWLLFWKLLLIGAFAVFALLTLVVAIGGFFDVRAMFRNVEAQHEAQKADRPAGSAEHKEHK